MKGEIIVTGSSEEEAIEEALDQLGLDEDAIEYVVEAESEDDLLPGAKPEIRVRAWIRPEYIAEQAEDVTAEMLELMGADFEIGTEIDGGMIRVEVGDCEMSSILIGREGQTLDAIQYILNRIILPPGTQAPLVIIDVEGYRKRQYGDLENLVTRAVKRARETGNEIELDPMPAVDRKYLHHYLTRFEGVKTFSRGDEPERYLVIVAD